MRPQILDTAGHVALYEFDRTEMTWSRLDVEGTLFVAKRRGQPRFRLHVLNKKGAKDHSEDVGPGFSAELQPPYLMYRSSTGQVVGIWFFDPEDCARFSKLLTKIVASVGGSVASGDANAAEQAPAQPAPPAPQAPPPGFAQQAAPQRQPAPAPAPASEPHSGAQPHRDASANALTRVFATMRTPSTAPAPGSPPQVPPPGLARVPSSAPAGGLDGPTAAGGAEPLHHLLLRRGASTASELGAAGERAAPAHAQAPAADRSALEARVRVQAALHKLAEDPTFCDLVAAAFRSTGAL